MPTRSQPLRQSFALRGRAAAVDALEGDETTPAHQFAGETTKTAGRRAGLLAQARGPWQTATSPRAGNPDVTQTSKRPQQTIAIGSGAAQDPAAGPTAPATVPVPPMPPGHAPAQAGYAQPPASPPGHVDPGHPGHAGHAGPSYPGHAGYAGHAPPSHAAPAQMPPAPIPRGREAELQQGGAKTMYEFTGSAAESGDPRLNRTFIGGGEIDLSAIEVERSTNLRGGALSWILVGLSGVLVLGAVLLFAAYGGSGSKEAAAAGSKADPAKEQAKEEPAKEEVKEEPAAEDAKEEPSKEEPVKEEPPKEEPVKEEPPKEEPAAEEPAKVEPEAPAEEPKPAPKPAATKPKPKPKPKPQPSSSGTTLSPKKPPRDPFANLPTPP
jgi:hypothetical protein